MVKKYKGEHWLRPRWRAMLRRCSVPHDSNYKNYGAKGIRVCKHWHSFDNFIADMGEPLESQSLDRIDNNGNYCPENCRWANNSTQQRNTSKGSISITYNGRTMHIRDWAKELRLSPSTLHKRYGKGLRGELLFAPPMARSQYCALGGSAGKGKLKPRHIK